MFIELEKAHDGEKLYFIGFYEFMVNPPQL